MSLDVRGVNEFNWRRVTSKRGLSAEGNRPPLTVLDSQKAPAPVVGACQGFGVPPKDPQERLDVQLPVVDGWLRKGKVWHVREMLPHLRESVRLLPPAIRGRYERELANREDQLVAKIEQVGAPPDWQVTPNLTANSGKTDRAGAMPIRGEVRPTPAAATTAPPPLASAHPDVLDPAQTSTCRDRLRQVLLFLDDNGWTSPEDLLKAVDSSQCSVGHELRYATLMSGLIDQNADGLVRLSRLGDDWLIEHGERSPDWRGSVAAGAPSLRDWQVEALEAWVSHGRHGVIEAVTGTGKSRVGIEATREALVADFSVVIAVPTKDLVDQWVRALKANHVPGVGALSDGQKASFKTHRVVVGTVQSLYLNPPVREDGRVLLVADECHRYGAGQWRRVLDGSYRRRLGLTATFERNDDGIKELLHYFDGGPIFKIGFQRAIADGVVAHYDVKLLGVDLDSHERRLYREADDALKDSRTKLLIAGFPQEPFGAFLYEVQKAAEDRAGDEDPTIVDIARRYLKAFSDRVEVMSSASAKIDAVRTMAQRVDASNGAILFTRRQDVAEEVAETLADEGVRAEAIHSGLTPTVRKDRLNGLKSGRIKALAAPTILDEGIDVPDIDLAVVLGGSKSRRQMIQRMGRVLRLKASGGKATFVVVFATDTVEDLRVSDGQEGCLDLIIESADSVEWLGEAERIETSAPFEEAPSEGPPAAAAAAAAERGATPDNSTTREAGALLRRFRALDPETLPITRRVLTGYLNAHGGSDREAERALRDMMRDFQRQSRVVLGDDDVVVARRAGHQLVVTEDRFVTYSSARADGRPWSEVRFGGREGAESDDAAATERAALIRSQAPIGDATPVDMELVRLHNLCITDAARQDFWHHHPATSADADEEIWGLVEAATETGEQRLIGDRVLVGIHGYFAMLESDGRTVVGYGSRVSHRTLSEYRGGGAIDDEFPLPFARTAPDSADPAEVVTVADLVRRVDPFDIYFKQAAWRSAVKRADVATANRWDAEYAVRTMLAADLTVASSVWSRDGRVVGLDGPQRSWRFRSDLRAVTGLKDVVANPASDASEMLPVEADTAERPAPREGSSGPAEPKRETSQPHAGETMPDVVNAIERLASLHDRGLLTGQEFAAAKAKVLGL